jgi:hypothetical protein
MTFSRKNVCLMRSHSEVIIALGGIKELAPKLGVDPKTAIHWPKRGIPAKLWHHVVRLAGKALPDLTIEELERTKPFKPQRRVKPMPMSAVAA